MNKEFTIIVLSCDSYQDIWKYFAKAFDKFWPDCPFDIYLISETISFQHSKIQNIKTGNPMPWSDMVIYTLDQIKTDYVIYLQEDYIFKGRIRNEEIEKYLRLFLKLNAAYLRLIPLPPPDKIINGEMNVGSITKTGSYRTSLQAAIWKKSVFKKLLIPSENGWQFEKNSISRAAGINEDFYSIGLNSDDPNINHHRYPIDYYSTAILQGKWQKEAIKILRKSGLKISSKQRGVLTRWDFFYYHKRKRAGKYMLKSLELLDKIIFNPGKKSKRIF